MSTRIDRIQIAFAIVIVIDCGSIRAVDKRAEGYRRGEIRSAVALTAVGRGVQRRYTVCAGRAWQRLRF